MYFIQVLHSMKHRHTELDAALSVTLPSPVVVHRTIRFAFCGIFRPRFGSFHMWWQLVPHLVMSQSSLDHVSFAVLQIIWDIAEDIRGDIQADHNHTQCLFLIYFANICFCPIRSFRNRSPCFSNQIIVCAVDHVTSNVIVPRGGADLGPEW